MIVDCDLHTRYQHIARLDMGTGEVVEGRVAQLFSPTKETSGGAGGRPGRQGLST
jgi:hypothetical protein